MTPQEQPELDRVVFEVFAKMHPFDCYQSDPERFWTYFHREHPTVTKDEMIEMFAGE